MSWDPATRTFDQILRGAVQDTDALPAGEEKSPKKRTAKGKTVAIQRLGSLENYIHPAHPYRSPGCANRTRGAMTGRTSRHRATAAKATSCVSCLRASDGRRACCVITGEAGLAVGK